MQSVTNFISAFKRYFKNLERLRQKNSNVQYHLEINTYLKVHPVIFISVCDKNIKVFQSCVLPPLYLRARMR